MLLYADAQCMYIIRNDYAVKTLVQSNVLSRLDYCNVIYTGLPQKSTRRLQLTQNAAVRLAILS